MNCQIETTIETYTLSSDFRVDFTAYAPLHTFKGWTIKGVEAQIGIDFQHLEIHHASASAHTRFFDTGHADRNQAMAGYMQQERFPEASIEMTKCKEFVLQDDGRYRAEILAVLDFIGVRRQLPVTFYVAKASEKITIDLAFKWSFKAYGLKAPRLLFLTVRDIVDIQGRGGFVLVHDG